jgi:hypothetical protein
MRELIGAVSGACGRQRGALNGEERQELGSSRHWVRLSGPPFQVVSSEPSLRLAELLTAPAAQRRHHFTFTIRPVRHLSAN